MKHRGYCQVDPAKGTGSCSLNHPTIAIIHGLEEADGVRALIVELVEEVHARRAVCTRNWRELKSEGERG